MTKPAAPLLEAAYSGLSKQIIKFEEAIGQLKAIATTRGAAYDEGYNEDIQQRRTAQYRLLAQIVGEKDMEDLATRVNAGGGVSPDGRILALVRAAAEQLGHMVRPPTPSESEKKRVLDDLSTKLASTSSSR